jgi:hydroxyacylglutathione hydrolase
MADSMFLETIHSEGLAHISYLLGHGGQAAVVDPRRDCRAYVEKAYQRGAEIRYIFETHRNEDYVVGSSELSHLTGATIYHGRGLDFQYGEAVEDGDTFSLGNLQLQVLETPGHTYESISIAVSDAAFGEEPVAVFTGDALFVGDVGRTDFFPDRADETAGLLYDSIFNKILPLGDQVILCPAHGAGSVCGEDMADREFSTLGYEKAHNKVLGLAGREAFVQYKVKEKHYQPPYFRQMETYNLEGSAHPTDSLPPPKPLGIQSFTERVEEGAAVLDVRSPEALGGALIPGALGIPLHMIPAFAGWFLPYDRDILLVVEDHDRVATAARYLMRLGYDRVPGFLYEGLHAWETAGFPYDVIPAVHARDLVRRMNDKEDFVLLDVRKESEFRREHLPDAKHVYVGELPDHLGEIPRDRPVITFCGSGQRAVIAATILNREGFPQVENCLGSMAACAASGCPVIQGEG